MKLNVQVDVHHLTRVEGHGNIRVRVVDGVVQQAAWDVVETPRYFEVMLKGKHYSSAGLITARICGICSIGHCLASVRASEDAFGIEIPPLARTLRLLAKHGETLQSHVLHLFFLAAPDFVALPSALPLLSAKPEIVHIAQRLKGLGNAICDVVAGRTTHPLCIQVGGLTRRPDNAALLALKQRLLGAVDDLRATVELFKTFQIPDFSRETEFVALQGNGAYPWIGGKLASTDGVVKSEREYASMTNEWVDEHNTTKWCRLSRESLAVGALARFNINHRLLLPEASAVAKALGLAPVCHNPFMNNVAQLVESVHVALESVQLIDEIVATRADAPVSVPVTPRAGEGVGAVEVPRGILYHHYAYGEDGRVLKANCVIPTTQNNKNIHDDMSALARQFAPLDGMTDDKLELLCSMLVRSYDPCISCSVH